MIPDDRCVSLPGSPPHGLLDPNFGRSALVTVIENRPLLSKISEPFGAGPMAQFSFVRLVDNNRDKGPRTYKLFGPLSKSVSSSKINPMPAALPCDVNCESAA